MNKENESFRPQDPAAKLQAPITYCPPGNAEGSISPKYVRPTSRSKKRD